MMFSSEEPPESINWLRGEFQVAALDPILYLGCDENPSLADIRNAFRKICLENLQGTLFDADSLCLKSEIKNWKISLFSYRLATKQFLTSPSWYGSPCLASFQDIANMNSCLSSSASYSNPSILLAAKPCDILMNLSPARSLNLSDRLKACKFLSVVFMGWELATDQGLPFQYLLFQVDYCMRTFIIKKRFSEFLELQSLLVSEMDVLPLLSKDILHKLLIGDMKVRGEKICDFLHYVHGIYATRGLYSPRLFKFLGIDVMQIHREEDSAIIHQLDKSLYVSATWYLIDQIWLDHWNRFVFEDTLNHPPGNISNENLLFFKIASKRHLTILEENEELSNSWNQFALGWDHQGKLTVKGNYIPKKNLVFGEDYRALAFNSWNYFKIVYKLGNIRDGAPCDLRKVSTFEFEEYVKNQSKNCQISRKYQDIYSDKQYCQLDAVVLIQSAIRRKLAKIRLNLLDHFKNSLIKSTLNKKNRKRKKKDKKNIIKLKDNDLIEKLKEENLIDVRSLIKLPALNCEDFIFTQELKIPLGLIQHPLTGSTMVASHQVPCLPFCTDLLTKLEIQPKLSCKQLAFKKLLKESKKESSDEALLKSSEVLLPMIGSQIMEVNDVPVSSLAHAQLLLKLRHASFPLSIQFAQFKQPHPIQSLVRLAAVKNAGILIQEFKSMLQCGICLKLHHGKKSYPTTVWVTSTLLLWNQGVGGGFISKLDLKSLLINYKNWKTKIKVISNVCCHLTQEMIRQLLSKYPDSFDGLSLHVEDYEQFVLLLKDILCMLLTRDVKTHCGRNIANLVQIGQKKIGSDFCRYKNENYCLTLHFQNKSEKNGKEMVLSLEVPKMSEGLLDGANSLDSSLSSSRDPLLPVERKAIKEMLITCFQLIQNEAEQSQVSLDENGQRKHPDEKGHRSEVV